jgi:site-specific recombinase XerD
MAGVDITTVKELLGHKTLTMTLRYAHLAPSHMVNAVDSLDKRLTGAPTAQ